MQTEKNKASWLLAAAGCLLLLGVRWIRAVLTSSLTRCLYPTYQYLPSPIPPPLSFSRAPKQNQTQSSTCCSCRFPPRTGSQLASYPGDADVLLGVEGTAARETTVEMAVTAASYVSPSLSAHARCRRPAAGWSCGRRFIRLSVSSWPIPKVCIALRCVALPLSLVLSCLATETQPSPGQSTTVPHLDECRPNADRPRKLFCPMFHGQFPLAYLAPQTPQGSLVACQGRVMPLPGHNGTII